MSTNDMISRLFNMKRYPESESKESIRVVAGLAIDALEKQQAEIERLRAAEIVRRVNLHDDMVEALRLAREAHLSGNADALAGILAGDVVARLLEAR